MSDVSALRRQYLYIASKNEPSGALLGPFGGQGAEMLKVNLLGTTWGHFVGTKII